MFLYLAALVTFLSGIACVYCAKIRKVEPQQDDEEVVERATTKRNLTMWD